MKYRPILFSSDMVRAILDGRKTQTRRVCKADKFGFKCPCGVPGDRLWVRETWKYWDWTEDGIPWIKYKADDSSILMPDCHIPEEWSDRLTDTWAELSDSENYERFGAARDPKWRPSIFMPRWASRIKLEVTGVRVERLQEISGADAEAEGADMANQEIRTLWDSINAKRGYGWDENPYVWVVEFRRVKE